MNKTKQFLKILKKSIYWLTGFIVLCIMGFVDINILDNNANIMSGGPKSGVHVKPKSGVHVDREKDYILHRYDLYRLKHQVRYNGMPKTPNVINIQIQGNNKYFYDRLVQELEDLNRRETGQSAPSNRPILSEDINSLRIKKVAAELQKMKLEEEIQRENEINGAIFYRMRMMVLRSHREEEEPKIRIYIENI